LFEQEMKIKMALKIFLNASLLVSTVVTKCEGLTVCSSGFTVTSVHATKLVNSMMMMMVVVVVVVVVAVVSRPATRY